VIVSQNPPIQMLNGEPYINTEQCEGVLERTSLDARYLGLVPPFVDRRNPPTVINLDDAEADDGVITTNTFNAEGGVQSHFITYVSDIMRPRLRILPPTIPQKFHLEIWFEKSTMNDIIMPLGVRYGINIERAVGEFSHTKCADFVARARASGKPVRILYGSHFDMAGQIMPVSVARKIEFMIRTMAPDLDVQVRCIVLTKEQCEKYNLPRSPAKDTDRRTPGWEERHGEGITELDALEALHPGVLEEILVEEIERYYDGDLDDRIEAVTAEVQADLDDITKRIHRKHAKALAALDAEREVHAATLKTFEKKVAKTLNKMKQDLEAEAPDPNDADWPEPTEGDEDPDPLFDSTRDYVTQIRRYKKHQGKAMEAKAKRVMATKQQTCKCGTVFTTAKGTMCEKCLKDYHTDAVRKSRAKHR
jgi:hypothetical protein